MDEASWNGTTDEVTDSEGDTPGTAFNNATTSSGTGSCRYGVFDNGGTITQGGVLVPGFSDLTSDFTITAWIRTTNNSFSGQRIFIDDETNSGGYGLSLGDGGTGMLRFYARGSSVIILDSAAVINNNTWYFVAGVADITNGIRRVYVYDASGTLLSTTNVASTGWGTDAGDASIGAETAASGEAASSFHFRGNLDEVSVYNKVLSQQALTALATTTHACAAVGPNHLQIEHGSGSGVTCTPSTLTIRACSDAAPSCTPYTSGVTGTMTNTGTPTVNWSSGTGFSIAAGASTTTKDVQVTTAGSVVFGIASPSPVPVSATTCNFGSPSCTFTSALAGFVVSVPNHVSCTNQTLTVRAVKQSDSSPVCVPAFASTSKTATISLAYTNPSTGTRVPTVGGTGIPVGGTSINLAFDAAGIATPVLVYNDVGQIGITVSYAGSGGTETGLVMTGTASPIVAPSSFSFSSITAAPITAGASFSATVTALNACSSPSVTPNFGRESTAEGVSMSFTRTAPTGVGASNGSFSGSVGAFSGGSATSSNLNWSEVGQGTLTATLASGSYLGSGLTATGTSGTVGRFKPAYFNTAVTVPGCSTFTYSGQPFTVTVTANKQGGGTTVNYSGAAGFGTSNATTLSDANGGTGTWANNTLATTDFIAGIGTKSTVSYTFASRQTAPTAIAVRAVESTGADLVSSSGHTEGTTTIYSGRFRLANAFGSEKLPLSIVSQAEYYSGLGWAVNSADNCTVIPLPTLTPIPGGLSTTATYANSPLSGGLAGLSLAAPSGTGYFDLTINVPGYLEFPWRSATASDPAARATFGIFKGNDRLIYRRERY
jgi:MSHA biogenesis protein MshQ